MIRITEEHNPEYRDLDLRTTVQILHLINEQDQCVPAAIGEQIPMLARAVDETTGRLRAGGRVFYIGAGTSGRIGILDSAEIAPTFGTDPDLFQAVIAGGYDACYASAEASEDDARQGELDLQARGCSARDVAVGITASGETPYTLGALAWARSAGALTIAVCCNRVSSLARVADIAVAPVVGPEVVAGSTRMKAGTAQKLVLNMFSTAVMVKLGKVYGNWMINVQMTNAKLRARGLRILMEATGLGEAECRGVMAESGSDLRVALVMLMGNVGAGRAHAGLEAHNWDLRKTLQHIRGDSSL